jgi:hypothetical protein
VLEFALDEARQAEAVGGLGAGLGQHRRQVALYDPDIVLCAPAHRLAEGAVGPV